MPEGAEDTEATRFARAFLALFDRLDGIADEMTFEDIDLVNEHWEIAQEAKAYLNNG
jgi:hypothetical protein